MRKARNFSLVLSILLCVSLVPASAIERGTLAEGNQNVVPIEIKTNSGAVKACSGTVISPRVVATAGHCLIESDGSSRKDVRVGPVGGRSTLDSTWSYMESFFFISTYRPASTVKFDDIAFMVLREPLKNAKYFEVPSEDQLLAMKRSNVPLTLIGYGTTSDTDANSSLLPSQISATYSSEWNATLTNTGYAQSSPGDTCSGDSGGPVIANYSGRSYVIGIITGAPPSINCTKAEAGGYFTSFTLINRYANILLMASNAALELEASSSISRNQANEAEISSLRNNLEQTRTQLDQANAEITRLKSKSITTITCIKGSLTKKISGVNPKCPTGYKKK